MTMRSSPYSFTCMRPACGKTIVAPHKKKRRGRRFCSHSCAAKFNNNDAINPALRAASAELAERRRGSGKGKYVKRGKRHEHRIVMEEKILRPLLPGEIVHHDDENGKNNAPINLVLTDRPEHARIHFLGKKKVPKTHCKNGHEFTSETVRITSAGRRRCILCAREYDNNWKKEKRNSK